MTRTQKTIVPRSKAKNAYDLLADVCAAISEEPRRYNQGVWCLRGPKAIRDWFETEDHKIEPPACGTMACRAGWIVQLHDGRLPRKQMFMGRVAERARNLLGVTNRWDDFGLDVRWLFDGAAVLDHQVGTRAYAKEGVKGLRQFMAKHKARLKATKFAKAGK